MSPSNAPSTISLTCHQIALKIKDAHCSPWTRDLLPFDSATQPRPLPPLYAMSLSKPHWNHFGPHHPFPEKQKFDSFYHVPSTLLPPLGLSISAAFAPGPNVNNSTNMNTLSADEMERFQKLSNEFQPDVQVSDGASVRTIRADHATGSSRFQQGIQPWHRATICQC